MSESEESVSQQTVKIAKPPNNLNSRRISRREFLKFTGVLAATAGLTQFLGGDTLRSLELEKEPSVLELDIYDTELLGRLLIKDNFPEGFSVEETFKKMGVTDPNSLEGLQAAEPETEEEYKLLMVKLLELKFKDHGKNVSEVGKKTAELISRKTDSTQTTQISIIEAIEINGISYDELGNPIMSYSISPDKVNNLLKSSPANLVNMSFQPGQNEIKFVMYTKNQDFPTMEQSYMTVNGNETPVGEPTYYDKERNIISKEKYEGLLIEVENNPKVLLESKERYIDYVDGYFSEHTQGNVEALIDIAVSNPDKVFIAAGGNPTEMDEIPDITLVRMQFEEKNLWPKNLIVVGYEYISDWVRMPASFGSDIYIDGDFIEDQIGYTESSSYATRIATEAVRQRVKTGRDFPQRVKDFLGKSSLDRQVGIKNEMMDYKVLNLQAIKTNQQP